MDVRRPVSYLGLLSILALTGPVRAQCPPIEVAEIEPTNPTENQRYGAAAAIGLDYAAIGAPFQNVGGAKRVGTVRVHERTAGGASAWGQVALVKASSGAAKDELGSSVALRDQLLVAGAPGADRTAADQGVVYLHDRDQGGAGSWGLVKELTAFDASTGAGFGTSVAISGSWIAVGAPGADVQGSPDGAVYLFFEHQGGAGNWGLFAKLTPSQPGSLVGRAVALSGDDLAVGGTDPTQVLGKVTVFERNAGGTNAWGAVASLNQFEVSFGTSVALSGDELVVGAPLEMFNSSVPEGAVFIYQRSSQGWGLYQELRPGGSQPCAYGASVAISGNRILVGAPERATYYPNLPTGQVYVVLRDWKGPGVWGTSAAPLPGGPSQEQFGASVALAATHFVIGAPRRSTSSPLVGPKIIGAADFYNFVPGVTSKNYCTSGVSGIGCVPEMFGDPTATLSYPLGCYTGVRYIEGGRQGALFFGTNGGQANPWGNGTSFQCVVPPVTRVAVMKTDGDEGSCDGSAYLDFNTWMSENPAKAPAEGDQVWMQFWYRDPLSTSNQTTSLSDGLTFSVCP